MNADAFFKGPAPGSPLDPSGPRRRRPLLWLALAFGAGIVLDDAARPALPALGGVAVTLLIVVPLMWWYRAVLTSGRVLFGAACVLAFAGGAMRHAVERLPARDEVRLRTPATPSLCWVEGTVIEARPAVGDHESIAWTVDLEALGGEPDGLTPAHGRAQLYHYIKDAAAEAEAALPFVEGDRLRALARIEAPAEAMLPEAFDHATYLARHGIHRVGVVDIGRAQVVGRAPWWRVDVWLRRAGGQWAQRNRLAVGEHRAALPNALLLGRREGLARTDREAFARAGTAHLLAISGLHVAGLAWLVGWSLGRLGVRRSRAAWIILAVAFAYASLAGLQPSAVRATVMIAVFVGAWWVWRVPDKLNTLAFAALLLLMVEPDDLFLAGFQLSFLAVLSLIMLYPTLEVAWVRWRNIPEAWIVDPESARQLAWRQRVRRAVFVSLAAWLGTAPAVAWHMGHLSLAAVALNLIAVPLAGLAMFCGLWFLVLGATGAAITTAPMTVLTGLNRMVAPYDLSSVDLAPPSSAVCAALFAVMVLLWVESGRRVRFPGLCAVLVAALVALGSAHFFRERPAAPVLTVLDLPRGQAALIESPGGGAALVDAGAPGEGERIGELIRRRGLRELALLVITEDDRYALGGAEEILRRVAVRRVILPRAAAPSSSLRDLEAACAARGIVPDHIDPGATMRGPGEVTWTFGSDIPTSGPPRRGSEALALRLAWPGRSVAFVRARSGESLKRLLADPRAPLEADVLRVTAGPGGYWPHETAQVVSRSGARVVVAGHGRALPEEGAGLDLRAFAKVKGVDLWAPAREGSLRMGPAYAGVEAYRGGDWRPLR